ncbi:flagellar biosynthetic protein FliR [candidate division WOR-1 bacterium RIFCSPHIGHO2_01_FULL_53_15]|uniref:Flagellar biosynthetic protein FliR n=1 Tax=candidate division WOR-1 bacterium RIFCSPHIGHO2_01_FULL_53_15 TaxID=1802564 RepID=A0A1F4Q037_UNCSA|nr:MAG: flagellar biosynthetic protein FliR [candidate division WOR-1 bacterium RIFCSPHIGHO2_01_FULL_53_15]OGC10847.1 MAG: flagellar biosynthetic protein FliR [candidate division WOR-1 bacterium RIFCSPHIGHO2_02_FULL_53_26]
MIVSAAQIEVFALILARIAGIFIQAPVFSSRSFAAPAKTAFAVWLTLLLWFVTPVAQPLPTSLLSFALTIVGEVAFGFTVGFIVNLLFIAIQGAGEIIDMQMGLSVASALDPIFGAVISVIGRLTFFIALIIFIELDGHHMVLSALHQSFALLPAGKLANFSSYGLVQQLMNLGAAFWLTAIKLAVPAILMIFLIDFTFGIVSRVAPQVNVFMLGFQVKPILGLFAISLTLPYLVRYIGNLLETIGQEVIRFMMIVK